MLDLESLLRGYDLFAGLRRDKVLHKTTNKKTSN